MFWRKKKTWVPGLAEIHEYTLDLQRVTVLRDKCDGPEERERYNTAIEVMQRVLIFMNTPPKDSGVVFEGSQA